jgi:hypothetical protein
MARMETGYEGVTGIGWPHSPLERKAPLTRRNAQGDSSQVSEQRAKPFLLQMPVIG